MMAADYRHIGGLENRLGRHYSRFFAFWPAPALAGQSLALRKLCDAGKNEERARCTAVLFEGATRSSNPSSSSGESANYRFRRGDEIFLSVVFPALRRSRAACVVAAPVRLSQFCF